MKQLKTLDGHNRNQAFIHGLSIPIANGIECPKCSMELVDSTPNEILTTYPPQKNVHCPHCDFKGYRVV